LKTLPKNALLVPLFRPKGRKIKMPRGYRSQLAQSPPATAWPRIMQGIEDFGLYHLYICAPREAFLYAKADPAIVAEKAGRFYLIAAWE